MDIWLCPECMNTKKQFTQIIKDNKVVYKCCDCGGLFQNISDFSRDILEVKSDLLKLEKHQKNLDDGLTSIGVSDGDHLSNLSKIRLMNVKEKLEELEGLLELDEN